MTSSEKEIVMKNTLFEACMKQQWERVSSIYHRSGAVAWKAKITKSGDTVLHILINCYHPAGSKNLLQHIKNMVDMLEDDDEALRVLKLQNERGDTPLHLAARLGNTEICKHILSRPQNQGKAFELIRERNFKKETPLFLAAHRGKMEAFRFLLTVFKKENHNPIDICRQENGDTILHSALSGEYFEMAYEIISELPELGNYVNEDGISPLHILATKPHAFKSSSYLGSVDLIIYHSATVRSLKRAKQSAEDDEILNNFPANWWTLVEFFKFVGKCISRLFGIGSSCSRTFADQNDPEEGNASRERDANKNDPTEQESWKSGNFKCTEVAEHKVRFCQISTRRTQGTLPENYTTTVMLFKLLMKVVLIILGTGFGRIRKIKDKKEMNTWAVQIMNELIEKESSYKYQYTGGRPPEDAARESTGIEPPTTPPTIDESPTSTNSAKPETIMKKNENELETNENKETPLLVAAKVGIKEIVEKILETFPVAIQDADANEKNVLLLAIENRQTAVYDFLLEKKKSLPEFVYYQVDNEGNSAVHLAAMYNGQQNWRMPGAALQLQGELKWYKYVKGHMARESYVRFNNKGQVPEEVFKETHADLTKSGTKWLVTTSNSCSVIAALIATVAFATSATIPGGVDDKTGRPILKGQPAFDAFAVSSLIALGFSVTALVFFLAILTSRCQQKDFKNNLPRKLLLGLTCLFTSIAAILISFCAGHFFVLTDHIKLAAFPIYILTCLPVTLFALNQLPLYMDLFSSIFQSVHFRSFKVSYATNHFKDKPLLDISFTPKNQAFRVILHDLQKFISQAEQNQGLSNLDRYVD
ncbi:PREDICTED: uncharacterized protein LOC109175152 [Ipomoea nil]|uniref:uncharacterized protein LOC109175152 n=1 Tax=Ipomoea nil TaxID=35883 RepID=UPI0009010075|nr:PREDICTED: uncharacterized protein LOC109175152 [Ipomoea nil]